MATKYKGVTIPTSGRDMELYSGKGAGVAAKAITAQLKRDIARVEAEGKGVRTVKDMAKLLGRVYKAGVYKVLVAHSRQGALDSEPCYHVGQALVDKAKRMLGIDYYCEDLAGWL